MKIRFIHVISAAIAIVFVSASVNAKNVPHNPVANNQSSLVKPSVRMPSDKIIFPLSDIEASEKSTTVTAAKSTLVKSTIINTAETTSSKVLGLANNTTAMASVKGVANNATTTTSTRNAVGTHTATITNVGTATENRTDGEGYLDIKNIIVLPVIQDANTPPTNPCPFGYTVTSTGDCKANFVEH